MTPRWLEILRANYSRTTNPVPGAEPKGGDDGEGPDIGQPSPRRQQTTGAAPVPTASPYVGVDISSLLGRQGGGAWPVTSPNVGPYPDGRPVQRPFPLG